MTIIDRRYSVAEGTAVKAPCRAATTANIALIGEQTIDGVAVAETSPPTRVLVKDQTTGADNGIYDVSTGNWSRARDFDGAYDIVQGTAVYIASGTVNARHTYLVTNTGTITIGTTALTFEQDRSSAAIAAAAAALSSQTAAASSATAAASSATAAAASATAAAGDTTLRVDGKTLYYDSVSGALKYAWASPADRTADLRDFLDAQYGVTAGVSNWTYRTAAHNGSDCVAAMEAALVAVRTRYGYGRVRVAGPGIFRFASGLSPTKLKGMSIEGDHANSAQMVFDCNSGVAFPFTGAGGYGGGGLRNLNVYIEDGYATSTLYQVLLEGDATYQPDSMTFENLAFTRLGSTSFWYNGFHAEGAARTSPQGIRVVNVKNVSVFCCRNIGAYFSNAVQWSVDNFGVYVGSGTGNDAYITGSGGGSSTETTQFDFRRFSIAGDLRVNNCKKVYLNGTASSVITNSTATYCSGFIEATLTGSFGSHSSVTVL